MKSVVVALLLSACTLCDSAPVIAANCPLRNPDRQLHEMFPDATHYRTIVANVDKNVKASVERVLGQPLALSDLGKHTLYMVLNGDMPIGFVHARTELGRRGGLELVWAMDIDLALVEFRVQRSRELYTYHLSTPQFRGVLIGRNLPQMRQLLTDLNTAVDIPALRAPPKAAKLIHSTIQSGTKMRIITERAFGHVVFKARLLGRLHVFHPGTATVRRIAPVTMDGRAGEIVMERTGGEPDQIDAKTLTVLRAFDHKQKPLGQMVYSRWTAHRSNAEIWWGVSQGGVINNMKIVGLVKDNFDEEIDQIVGKRLSDLFVSEDMGDVSLTRSAIEVLSVIEAKREQTGKPD